MVDRRRHASNVRFGPVPAGPRSAALQHLHRGGRTRGALGDVFDADHAEPRYAGRFRWLVSTCLAATVGALAIVVVIYGSADPKESADGILPTLQRISEGTATPPLESMMRRDDGLKWAVPRSDRLQVLAGVMSTRYTIHDTLKQKKGGREYLYAKPYVRIMLRLAPVPPNYADVIPPFNPFKLYANTQPVGTDAEAALELPSDVKVRVVELLGGILPGEDGQELDNQEVAELIERTESEAAANAERVAATPDQTPTTEGEAGSPVIPADTAAPPNTTIMAKSTAGSDDDADDFEELKRVVKTVEEGDTLIKILTAAGAETWQAKEMIESAKKIFPESSLAAGQEVHIALAPSLTKQNRMEPVRFSIIEGGSVHRVTVSRSASGEFVASTQPVDEEAAIRAALTDGDKPQSSSLYASLYAAALMQQVPSETIMQILRIHAYEADFRRRVRPGDSVELFFDLKEEVGADGPPGELLYTAVTAGGETTRYFRYRTSDGQVDFYDEEGNNSRKFLMRRPVRGEDVRLTSGFGLRRHPLLGVTKMHTGIDWAASPGTPILAAGNGTIDEAGRKSNNGNYVRIRHANGYQTAYSHMLRFADGVAQGIKVRQGQVIGYVGSTGLSSGPHLHFEVLVNSQFVDPMSIEVPREKKLQGYELADFQKERARLEDLKARAPVQTSSR